MPKVIVLDTSLAVKWNLTESFTNEARMLLRDWEERSISRIVPSWFACEVANVLYKAMRKGTISLPLAQVAVEQMLRSVVVRDFDPHLSIKALELADQFGQSATYDSHYLALADQEACELWTADKRFWNATKGSFPIVRWVGEMADEIVSIG